MAKGTRTSEAQVPSDHSVGQHDHEAAFWQCRARIQGRPKLGFSFHNDQGVGHPSYHRTVKLKERPLREGHPESV